MVVGALAVAAYKITGLITKGHRVSPEVELRGLDIPEMGVLAYPAGESTDELPIMFPVEVVHKEAPALLVAGGRR